MVRGGPLNDIYIAGPNDVWAVAGNYLVHRTGTTWTKVVPEGAQPGGVSYFYRAVDGTGSGDVWAVGLYMTTEPSNMPGLPFAYDHPILAHLTCGRR